MLRGVSDCHGAIDHRGPLLFDPAGYPAAGSRQCFRWLAGLDEMLGLFRKPDVRVFLVTAFGVYLTTPMVYQVMPAYTSSRAGFPGRGCRQP